MWRPIATIAAAARDVELEDPVLKLSGYSIYINLVLNIFIFLGGGPTLNLHFNYNIYINTFRANAGVTTHDTKYSLPLE